MSDELNSKIKQIADALGQEKLPDNLMGLLSMLASSASSGKEENQKIAESPPPKEEKKEKTDFDDSMDMIGKIRKAMDRIGNVNDPRINLLSAIRPFMNTNRQKKINNCISLLRISGLARYMDENGKGLF